MKKNKKHRRNQVYKRGSKKTTSPVADEWLWPSSRILLIKLRCVLKAETIAVTYRKPIFSISLLLYTESTASFTAQTLCWPSLPCFLPPSSALTSVCPMGKFSVFVLRHQVPFADMQEGVRSDEAQRKMRLPHSRCLHICGAFVYCTVFKEMWASIHTIILCSVNIHINKEVWVCVCMRVCEGGRERDLNPAGYKLGQWSLPWSDAQIGFNSTTSPQPRHTFYITRGTH